MIRPAVEIAELPAEQRLGDNAEPDFSRNDDQGHLRFYECREQLVDFFPHLPFDFRKRCCFAGIG